MCIFVLFQVKRRRIVEEVDSAMVEPPAKQRSESYTLYFLMITLLKRLSL